LSYERSYSFGLPLLAFSQGGSHPVALLLECSDRIFEPSYFNIDLVEPRGWGFRARDRSKPAVRGANIGDPNLVGAAPPHADAMNLVLLWNVQVELVG
jgi:hypothetical protein